MKSKISLRTIVESVLSSRCNSSFTIKEITAHVMATELEPVNHQLDKADGNEGVAEHAIFKNITSILSKYDIMGITRLKKGNTSKYGIFTDQSTIPDGYDIIVKQPKSHSVQRSVVTGTTATSIPTTVVEALCPAPMNDSELDLIIRQRFEMLDLFSAGFISGHITSLVISGAAGIGKTYNLQKALEGSDLEFKKVTGAVSGIGMYKLLYQYSDENCVIMFDDADVFKDETSIDILKGALDSSEKREVSWVKASSFLDEHGIPTTFEFKGRIVFITNKDIERMISGKETPMTPHYKALLSRSTFLNLGIHTVKQINMYLKMILIENDGMRNAHGISLEQAIEITEFFDLNLDKLRMLSLREVIDCHNYMKISADNWKVMAQVALFRGLSLAT